MIAASRSDRASNRHTNLPQSGEANRTAVHYDVCGTTVSVGSASCTECATKRVMRSLLLLVPVLMSCGSDPTGPIWAKRYDPVWDCLGPTEEIGRYPGRSPRVIEDTSAWIRNDVTSELWFLNTTTDLAHLDEDWDVAECNARPCVADIGPGGATFTLCPGDADAGSSGPGAPDAD